jgi:DNA polymerase-3 subunit epsilon
MNLIRDTLFAAVDFESAGEAPGMTDAPVQAGIAAMRGTELMTAEFYRTYINPRRAVTWAAQRVHGITDEHLTSAPDITSLWPEFRTRLTGAVVVAHAAGTEKRFLRIFPFHGFGPWIDTLALARKAWPGLRDYSLEGLAAALGFAGEIDNLCPGLRFHDALYDAVGSLLVLRSLVTGAGLADRSVEELLQADPD